MCTNEGVIFDIENILPYVTKYKKSPITGEPLQAKDLIYLNIFKDEESHWHCPVQYKVFNDNSHIVVIKPSKNVYSYEAIEELCLKPKYMVDPMTGEKFTKKEIITIQDPKNIEHCKLRDISNFKHLKVIREEEAADWAAQDHRSGGLSAARILRAARERRWMRRAAHWRGARVALRHVRQSLARARRPRRRAREQGGAARLQAAAHERDGRSLLRVQRRDV